MKAFLVYWHPEPQSFNHAMFVTAQATLTRLGAEVKTSDLYAMAFDPVSSRKNFTTVRDPAFLKLQTEEIYASEHQGFASDLDEEMAKLEWCDLMIWQFPLWWFGLPATMKGWVDRVFAMGRIYGGRRMYEGGVFRGKRALLSLTTGGPEQAYVQQGFHGDINAILQPIQRGMLQFVGFDVLAPQVVYGPVRMSDTQRQAELDRFAQRLGRLDQETPLAWETY
ncbi:NAD(P)H-dependent oxidoreductase [Candidatus Chloroploca sp. M-50]|uniref:NAD(P)H-dependent oxidoreductase n=1 Tax=Candidatus Chloroploca mongolica TaxID=2528176 RepID=A0ABS4DGC5_9CHLR|nr:NAD(P)H-dependent oxidoreductase [Candidatus Chloroploca mongolica]